MMTTGTTETLITLGHSGKLAPASSLNLTITIGNVPGCDKLSGAKDGGERARARTCERIHLTRQHRFLPCHNFPAADDIVQIHMNHAILPGKIAAILHASSAPSAGDDGRGAKHTNVNICGDKVGVLDSGRLDRADQLAAAQNLSTGSGADVVIAVNTLKEAGIVQGQRVSCLFFKNDNFLRPYLHFRGDGPFFSFLGSKLRREQSRNNEHPHQKPSYASNHHSIPLQALQSGRTARRIPLRSHLLACALRTGIRRFGRREFVHSVKVRQTERQGCSAFYGTESATI